MLQKQLKRLLKIRDTSVENIDAYFLFDTISQVFACEKLCAQNCTKYKLRPVPRNLSSDCGVCLQTSLESANEIEKLMIKSNTKFKELCIQ